MYPTYRVIIRQGKKELENLINPILYRAGSRPLSMKRTRLLRRGGARTHSHIPCQLIQLSESPNNVLTFLWNSILLILIVSNGQFALKLCYFPARTWKCIVEIRFSALFFNASALFLFFSVHVNSMYLNRCNLMFI